MPRATSRSVRELSSAFARAAGVAGVGFSEGVLRWRTSADILVLDFGVWGKGMERKKICKIEGGQLEELRWCLASDGDRRHISLEATKIANFELR